MSTQTLLKLPCIENYGEYSSDNFGAHTLRVHVGGVIVWFSYKTPVAFKVDGHERVVIKNYWKQTTGKHLNWIDNGDKNSRVSREEFQRLWNEQVKPLTGEECK